ncbi:hypothetical protein ACOME3_008598 [Neoechinorhynchus agilis]
MYSSYLLPGVNLSSSYGSKPGSSQATAFLRNYVVMLPPGRPIFGGTTYVSVPSNPSNYMKQRSGFNRFDTHATQENGPLIRMAFLPQ